MPIYEYFCIKCGILEVIQKMQDESIKICPRCQSQDITKLISSTATPQFKGSGFYETDYKKKSK